MNSDFTQSERAPEIGCESATAVQLKELGRLLDQGLGLRVKNGGIVRPGDPGDFLTDLGLENERERQRPSGPATGSWEGTSRWQGATRGSWSSSEAASILGAVPKQYDAELDVICEAYPGARIWHRDGGFWLLSESRLLPGFPESAMFLTGVSFTLGTVRSWGYWKNSADEFRWIGPRHTNSPDGSICAFDVIDGTWLFGDPLVELLDLYTVWALRHAHLQLFGRWPGHQSVRLAFERVMEFREDELCGCGSLGKLYRQCCRDDDFARNRVADAVAFILAFGLRKPPDTITQFLSGTARTPPRLEDCIKLEPAVQIGLGARAALA